MTKVMYQPRMDDPVCVARFDTKEEADAHMEYIKEKSPKAFPHHYIEEQRYVIRNNSRSDCISKFSICIYIRIYNWQDSNV